MSRVSFFSCIISALVLPCPLSLSPSYTLALLGVEALELHRVASPHLLSHPFFVEYDSPNPAVRSGVKARLGSLDEVLTSMVDARKSERAAVSVQRFSGLGSRLVLG